MVKQPTWLEMAEFMLAIGSKYPTLLGKRVWGACDGLKILLEKSTDWQIQNRYYNGWTSDTYVNDVFVFSPEVASTAL